MEFDYLARGGGVNEELQIGKHVSGIADGDWV